MNNQKSLKNIRKNSFIAKIKEIFIEIFYKKDIVNNYRENKISNIDNKKVFRERIKSNVNVEENVIYQKLKSGAIKVEDLTTIQKSKMIEFYKKQITNKKEKLFMLKKV